MGSNYNPEERVFYDEAFKDDDFSNSNEQYPTWFVGTLIEGIKPWKDRSKNMRRLAILHNRITAEETDYSERYETNSAVASQLSEFFLFKWLLEITAVFQKTPQNLLSVKTYRDRVCSYLGYIDLYLTFRGLTLLESTLTEINESLHLEKHIKMREVRNWKLKIIRITPELKERWIRIRAQAHQDALLSTVVKVMNNELDVTDCSKEVVFQLKQECLRIAKDFASTPKCKHVKNQEIWARAVCAKAFRIAFPDCSCDPFPQFPRKTQKVINNKRWQLDQIIP